MILFDTYSSKTLWTNPSWASLWHEYLNIDKRNNVAIDKFSTCPTVTPYHTPNLMQFDKEIVT